MLWVFTVEMLKTPRGNSKRLKTLAEFTVENTQNINRNSKCLVCLLLKSRKWVFATVNAILRACVRLSWRADTGEERAYAFSCGEHVSAYPWLPWGDAPP